MASFSSLVTILNQNKLIGSKYVDWKRNLDIVLTAEEHKYVLTKPCPSFPSLDAPLEEKQQYDRWQKSNEMAKCYILASFDLHPSIYLKCSTASNAGCRTSFRHHAKSEGDVW